MMMRHFIRLFSLLAIFSVAISTAQSQGSRVLIHYWNFDNTPTVTLGPSTPIPDIKASYSVIDTNAARVTYYLLPGTSLTATKRYIDSYTGTDTNARYSVVPTGPSGNFALRLRNPLDSMESRILMPTTGYTGILITYALQSSSAKSGDSVDLFDYSVDGGQTWKNGKANGMKVNGVASDTVSTLWNTYQGDVNWGSVTVDLSADKTVENNPKFVFRIRFQGNASLTSGNNRIDNMTVEGYGATKVQPPSITVKQPGNNILVAGRHASIMFDTANNVGAQKTIDYSTDGGTTWSSVGTTSSNSYDWVVPSTGTANGVVRVKDGEGTVGMSAPFVIAAINPKTNRIIHYWDFNGLTKAYNNPSIPVFTSDFSANESAQGTLSYALVAGASSTYKGYVDNVAGDLGNAQFGVAAGQALRVRNPTDSMELHFKIPTTGFKNIGFNYVIEESSNISPLTRNFDYSTNGGTSWITTGLSITTESNLDSTKFDPVSVSFASGSAAENNPNLMFRIRMTGGQNSGTSGNDRYDNITVTGDPIVSSVADNEQPTWNCSLSPNPASSAVLLSTPTGTMKNISIIDMAGREVSKITSADKSVTLNISAIAQGVYLVKVVDAVTGNSSVLTLVKQ